MKTYLVNLTCYFPRRHRSDRLELLVTVRAESPEGVEAPLREIITRYQAKAGYHQLFVRCLAEIPADHAVLFSQRHYKNGPTYDDTETEWLYPAWVEALEDPWLAAQESDEFYDSGAKAAAARGEPPPEYDEGSGVGFTVKPFMRFRDVVIPAEDLLPEPPPV